MPTATEAINMLEGQEQCERRQQTKSGGYIAPSIVDGDDIFWVSLRMVGYACKSMEGHLFSSTLFSPDCHFSKHYQTN